MQPVERPGPELDLQAQQFVMDAVVRTASGTRRITAAGRDIYAVTAPIVVEGAIRLLEGRYAGPGAVAPAQAFDAVSLLAALEREAGDFTVSQ